MQQRCRCVPSEERLLHCESFCRQIASAHEGRFRLDKPEAVELFFVSRDVNKLHRLLNPFTLASNTAESYVQNIGHYV